MNRLLFRWRRRRRRCDSSSCQWKWGPCSRSCGGGVQSPIVTKPQGSCGSCNLPKQRQCNTQCCRVDCRWGGWSQFQPCSKTCGSGVQHRGRKIVVQASCGGRHCVGSASESRTCNTNCCPRDCKWGSWAGLTPCTKSCGTGTQVAHRKKEETESCGGKPCKGSTTKISKCNTKCCPVDCKWGLWEAFGRCSASCGGGMQTRKRKIALSAKCGGAPCSGESQEKQKCNLKCCPVNCKWGSWSKFSSCSASCGGGSQLRTREISIPNSCGGVDCVGSSIDKRSCGEKCCPVDCVWGAWSKFDTCTATCGTGKLKLVLLELISSLVFVTSFIFVLYCPYLSSIYKKANCLAIFRTGRPHSLGSCPFRGVWATCLPHKGRPHKGGPPVFTKQFALRHKINNAIQAAKKFAF